MAKVLVLGGCGFIGRNFVEYLVKNNLASTIRVVDKMLPQISSFGKQHQEAFDNAIVEFKQGSLTSPATIEKHFKTEAGEPFDFIFNCAAETKYGQTDEVYDEKVLDLSVKCATEAAKLGVKKFVELSTGQVYKSDKGASKESGKLSPWTKLAQRKLQAEEKLQAMDGLNLVVLRPATVYGPGDSAGVAPRVIIGAVYKHLGEKMKFLWTEKLALNTVHVTDLCKAMWHATTLPNGSVFNVADKSSSNQGSIAKLIGEVFGISTGFHGSIISNLAKLKLEGVTEEANDKHLKPWSELCKADNINNTPLTPYLDMELLANNALSIDGSAIEATGFTYDHPNITVDDIREEIAYYRDQGLFPNVG